MAVGTLALQGAILLQMGRMNKVLEVDSPPVRGVQAGVFNADVSPPSPPRLLLRPRSLECHRLVHRRHIAMNAGGPHCFKYGVTSNPFWG